MLPTRPFLIAAVIFGLAWTAPCQMTLTCTQPCGDGSFRLHVTGCGAFAEIFNLISLNPYTPTGQGPIFGLNAVGSAVLLTEILLPLGTEPFHVNAGGDGSYEWQFCLPPNNPVIEVPADVVTVRWSLNGYFGQSDVVHINARL
jgi:hypothetical protein